MDYSEISYGSPTVLFAYASKENVFAIRDSVYPLLVEGVNKKELIEWMRFGGVLLKPHSVKGKVEYVKILYHDRLSRFMCISRGSQTLITFTVDTIRLSRFVSKIEREKTT